MNKTITIAIVVFLAAGLGSFAGVKINSSRLGGLVHNIQENFDAGIAVNGTEAISASRGANFATGTFSGIVNVQGSSTVESLITGGTIVAISATNTALTAAQVCNASVITWTTAATKVPDSLATTTLPSETALMGNCLSAVGKTKTILFRNIGSAASSTIIVAGTDITLLEPTSSNAIIAGSQSALITFIRQVASTTVAIIVPLK